MIYIDENEPEGVLEPAFPPRDVRIQRNTNAETIYELLHEVGRGKFGTVYKCKEKATGLQLAAKFVPVPLREDRRAVEREVEIMNSLQHHLIIQLYAAYEFQKDMCVVLELVEGGELFDRVVEKEFVLTEGACIVFMRQVCEALEFIHNNNILHLDLKPENILCLSKEGNRIKIIDFGLARKFDPNKKLQVLFGTPEFVAPEVVNFDCISYATDMWSVGVICYVLISGLSPFLGETDVTTMANVTIAKYDFEDESFNNVSPECLDFISKFLVKDMSKRMTAEESLKHKWLQKRPRTKPISAQKPVTSNTAVGSAPEVSALTPPPEPESKLAVNRGLAGLEYQSQLQDELPTKELNSTKDNLKTFIERWEQHPNSPYVFDVDSRVIAPLNEENTPYKTNCSLNAGVGASSTRVRSPSSCASVSTITEEKRSGGSDSPQSARTPIKDRAIGQNPEELRQIEKYLHESHRRNSDTNYLLGRRSSAEPANLADKINKLSDFLRMLSEIDGKLAKHDGRAAEMNPAIEVPMATKSASSSSKGNKSDEKVGDTVGANLKDLKTVKSGKSRVLKLQQSIEETPKLRNGVARLSESTVTTINSSAVKKAKGSSSSTTNKTKPKGENLCKTKSASGKPAVVRESRECRESKNQQSETASNRRSKFRVNQMSRDVPVGLPDTHRPVNLEEVANNTKDCLLHLLEKYQERQFRNPLGRHMSISVDWHVGDNLSEYRSMNSINAFFQRHSNAGGQFVKQMQAQFEEKAAKK